MTLANAGLVTWRSGGGTWISLSYHWLDALGNPIVWDGLRAPFRDPVAPGETAKVELDVRAPIPPGRYRLALDLIDEERVWFSELGNPMLEREVDVRTRIAERTLGVVVRPGAAELVAATRAALATQLEPTAGEGEDVVATAHLAAGCLPAADWSRRVLDAHAEGYAAVGGSVEPLTGRLVRRRVAALAPWAPGGGRKPSFGGPLLCPSLLRGWEPVWIDDVEGLPALELPRDEPWVYDARITMRARLPGRHAGLGA